MPRLKPDPEAHPKREGGPEDRTGTVQESMLLPPLFWSRSPSGVHLPLKSDKKTPLAGLRRRSSCLSVLRWEPSERVRRAEFRTYFLRDQSNPPLNWLGFTKCHSC